MYGRRKVRAARINAWRVTPDPSAIQQTRKSGTENIRPYPEFSGLRPRWKFGNWSFPRLISQDFSILNFRRGEAGGPNLVRNVILSLTLIWSGRWNQKAIFEISDKSFHKQNSAYRKELKKTSKVLTFFYNKTVS